MLIGKKSTKCTITLFLNSKLLSMLILDFFSCGRCKEKGSTQQHGMVSMVLYCKTTVCPYTVPIMVKDSVSVHITYSPHYFHAFSGVSSIYSEFPFSGSVHTAELRQVREHLPVLTHKVLIAILSRMLFLLTPIINSCLSFSSRW